MQPGYHVADDGVRHVRDFLGYEYDGTANCKRGTDDYIYPYMVNFNKRTHV